MTRWQRWLRRTVLLWGGAGGLVLAGCGGGGVTSFAAGVRVDQILARELSVDVTDTTAAIAWTTRDATVSRVDFGTTASLGGRVETESSVTAHRVDLTGLAPDTVYFFRVQGSGSIYRFRTLGGQRTRIAFVSDRTAGRREVFLAFDWGENVAQVTDGGGYSPALSADGKLLAWVAMLPDGHQVVFLGDVTGAGFTAGSARRLSDVADRDELEPTWSPDGTQVAFVAVTAGRSQLVIRTVAGGAETVVLDSPATIAHPRWKPDGKRLVIASTVRTALVQAGTKPVDPDSSNVFLNDGQRTPIGPEQYQLVDSADGLFDFSGSTAADRDVAIEYTSNGTAVTLTAHVPRPHLELFTIQPDGKELRRLTDSGDRVARMMPTWHPTQDLIIFVTEAGAATNLYSVAGTGGALIGLSSGAFFDRDPVVSPDGNDILFSSNRHPDRLVNLCRTDFAGNVVELNLFSSGDTQPSWSVVP